MQVIKRVQRAVLLYYAKLIPNLLNVNSPVEKCVFAYHQCCREKRCCCENECEPRPSF